MKGPDGRGLQTKEETMSTFTTIASLQHLTNRELDILFRSVTDRLAGYAEGTAERREALATLALIRRVIAQRQMHRPKPGL
jgi:hypothetical protein